MLFLKFLFVYFFFINNSFCQKNDPYLVKIKDSILIKNIIKYSNYTKKINSDLKEKGYISLEEIYKNTKALNKEIKFKYHYSRQYYRPKNKLPCYYSFINENLILIFDESLRCNSNNISRKKQKKVDKIIKPYLSKPIHLKLKDENGNYIFNDKNFRDETIILHGGRILIIYGDNSFEIKKYPNY